VIGDRVIGGPRARPQRSTADGPIAADLRPFDRARILVPMPGLSDKCGVCGATFLFSLPRCGFCHGPMCATCSTRVGGSIFCGKACGHNFFYGADEDIEDIAGSDVEDE
jgi:hypothetical protein